MHEEYEKKTLLPIIAHQYNSDISGNCCLLRNNNSSFRIRRIKIRLVFQYLKDGDKYGREYTVHLVYLNRSKYILFKTILE